MILKPGAALLEFQSPYVLFFLWRAPPITCATMKPRMKPMNIAKGNKIMCDMPIFQNNKRSVTTWAFWTRIIRKRPMTTNSAMVFGFIAIPLPSVHYYVLWTRACFICIIFEMKAQTEPFRPRFHPASAIFIYKRC